MKKFLLPVLLALLAPLAPAHEHYAAGYLDTNGDKVADAGDRLQLVTLPPDGMFFHMLLQPVGQRYAGYYVIEDELPRTEYPNDSFTFIALSDGQTELDGKQHAATGSDIWMEITSVSGPVGGSFGFWDIDENGLGWSYTHTTPTASFPANEPTGGYKFEISEPLTSPVAPTEDPYGHIHERGYTADTPGVYVVGFTLHDMSTNGPGGGPIEQPSQTYYFTFVAGVPDPTPTPKPTPVVRPAPTVRIAGAKKRVVSAARIVLRGVAKAPAGLVAVQLKTTGGFRAVSRSAHWKVAVRLKKGANRIRVRARDAAGRYSVVRQVIVRRK